MAIDWDKIKREYEITDIKLCDLAQKAWYKISNHQEPKAVHGWAKEMHPKRVKMHLEKRKERWRAPGKQERPGNKGVREPRQATTMRLSWFFKLIFRMTKILGPSWMKSS